MGLIATESYLTSGLYTTNVEINLSIKWDLGLQILAEANRWEIPHDFDFLWNPGIRSSRSSMARTQPLGPTLAFLSENHFD